MAKRIAKLQPSATPKETEFRPSQEEIAARAYTYYETEGRIPGRDTEYWLRAEADLMAEKQNGQTHSAPKASSRGRRGSADVRNN